MREFNLHGFVRVILLGVMLYLPARAEIYDFSFSGAVGYSTVFGPIAGTVDLPFVGPGGSGTGAAASLTLTSLPAGFGTLAGGDVVTSWVDQIDNTFTVTAGQVTSFLFFAATGNTINDNIFCLNSTRTNAAPFGPLYCPSGLNELQGTMATYESNLTGRNGITFSDENAALTPEPGYRIFGLLLIAGIAAGVRRSRHRLSLLGNSEVRTRVAQRTL